MKKILMLGIMAFVAVAMYGQKDVTTFLGIPVDGYKSEMKQKLISKGFTLKNNGDDEYLEGEFNGMDVHVFISTNNNKVFRIALSDAKTCSEADIKIRFNNLVRQFQNNKRYISLKDYTLSESEDISYEMLVHKKNFDAYFYQLPNMEKIDSLTFVKRLGEEFFTKYSTEQLENPTEEMLQEYKDIKLKFASEYIFKKSVWFRIYEFYGKYYIMMYYDNEYNRANGDDL